MSRHVDAYLKPLAILAAVIAIVLVGLYVFGSLAGSGAGGPRPTASPSPAPSASVAPAGAVDVTLGIYSGRPDPRWSLTAEQAGGLEKLLANLPEGTGTPPVGGLGYHGFTIVLPGGTLIAYHGMVAPPGEGSRTVKADPTRSVERYLLETSRSHVAAGEAAEVERALAMP